MTFMTALLDGCVGIVAGILTSLLLFASKKFIQRVILPAYRVSKYQGVILEGPWFGLDDDQQDEQAESELTLQLDQNAHELSGTLRLQHQSSNNNFDLNFKVTGYIWEGYITLNLRPADRQVTSYAAGLLKVSGGGVSLSGQLAYRDANEDCVSTLPIVLLRGSRAVVRPQIIAAKARNKARAELAAIASDGVIEQQATHAAIAPGGRENETA